MPQRLDGGVWVDRVCTSRIVPPHDALRNPFRRKAAPMLAGAGVARTYGPSGV
ncbi:MAG: hypothetical protein AMXMBFR64_30990 [Myxococcales bacterium]